MRQSDGSEILGPHDPRNLVIGIIHVSPNDDRQSVVNAIAAQDKQGRDQIVLVLPVQNKSFKSAVDFAGLHQISSELEAALVLVVPEKSKIANFARKESFTIYPTLEELASSEFPPLEPDSTPGEYDEAEQTLMFPLELPNTPSASANPPAPPPAPVVPPSAPIAQQQQVDTEEEEEEEPTSPSLAVPKMPPAPVIAQEEEEEPTSPSLAVPKMPPAPMAAQEEEGEPTSPSLGAPGIPPAAATDQQATSGRAGRGAPGSYLPAVVPNNTGALVPQAPQLPVYYEPLGPPMRRRSWRGLIITGVTVVVLIGLAVLFNRPILDLLFPPTATVTIVPMSQRLVHTYQITAVLGVPDPSKNQVDARALYADSQTQTQTVRATGQGHIAGQQAHGELTFYNGSASPQTITAGTVVFDPNGNAVVTSQTITLPALDTTTGLNSTVVLAHTVNTGVAQNIPAYDFDSSLCCNGAIYVTNTQPFAGGQNQQSFTYVQQSDIDSVTQSLGAGLTQQATMSLQGQVRSNEKAAGAPRCSPQVKSDHQAGDRASSVSVSVTTSCVGEVYDLQAVQVLAARKLNQDAATSPGLAYAPVGNIVVQVAQATPDARGNVLLTTNAAGVWAYQFSAQQRAQFARLIAGKSAQQARTILLGQAGVQSVTIALTGAGVTSVPGDTSRITVNVEAVQGLHP